MLSEAAGVQCPSGHRSKGRSSSPGPVPSQVRVRRDVQRRAVLRISVSHIVTWSIGDTENVLAYVYTSGADSTKPSLT